jgi:hypothetical protein
VHDAHPVGVAQPGRDAGHGGGRLGRRQRAPGPQELTQAAAGHQLHDQAERLADGEQVAHRHDVLVVERAEDGPLLHEPHDGLGLRHQLLAQELDRHLVAGGLVEGPPDRAAGAAADLFDEGVRAADHPFGRGFRH